MRRGLLALGVCALFAASCGGGRAAVVDEDEPTMTGLPFSSYSHEDEPFAQELFNEQVSITQVDDDELYFIPGDMDGTYTHVDGIERRSLDTPGEGPTVWFFGGSTLFGIGQRDEHTIPSEVARIAHAAGTPIEVGTFGFPSYAAWQEAGLLRRALAQGAPPDLIVFYHGANDLGAICRQLALGIEPGERGNPLFEQQPEEPAVDCKDDPDETGRLVARTVQRAMDEARQAASGIPIIEFWQPFAATRVDTPSDGPLLERLGLRPEDRQDQLPAYLAALEHRTDEPPIDLTDAMDDYDGPIYFDFAHTNELGARLVAEAMWERSLSEVVASLGTSR